MKRRDFMRLTATAGGMLMCGGARLALAQSSYSGPFWLFVEADGGWDPTSFCDPKGAGLGPNGDINNYDAGDIRQVGNIRYAPPPDMFANNTTLFSNRDFFEAHYQRLLVVNGINHGTNSHAVGRTACWTGTRALDYPSIAALIASETAGNMALPMVATSSTESSKTKGVVPRTLVGNGDLSAIREIAFPNRTSSTSNTGRYHGDGALALIEEAARARRQRQLNQQRLLRLRNALGEHNASRNRDVSALREFVGALDSRSRPNSYVRTRGLAFNLFNAAQTAFAAFESGAAATAQVRMLGFDTHLNHDERHYPRLMDYFAAVDNIISDAKARGIGDRLIIVMASDFARTNTYNVNSGKDHWPHTSMMFWGAPAHLRGNRVIGATNNMQRSRRVNPSTLALDPNGIEMTPEYIHQSLRNLAGIEQNPSVTANFPFAERALPLFA